MTPHEVLKATDAAERAVLGSMLRDPSVIGDVVAVLTIEDFRQHCHCLLFRAMLAMWDRRSVIDTVTLAEELARLGEIKDVGYSLIGELVDAAPSPAQAGYYANLTLENATLRRLRDACIQGALRAEAPQGPVAEVVAEVERNVLAVADRGQASTVCRADGVVNSVLDRIDARARGDRSIVGLETGFPSLDEILGGLRPGELIVVAARPGIGKTSALAQIGVHAATDLGVAVAFVSLEQGREEVFERMLCSMASVNTQDSQRGRMNREDAQRLHEAASRLRRAPLFIDDLAHQRVLRIAATARRLKKREGLGLLLVDYLQLVEPESRRDPRHEQVGQISRRLKMLARELGVPLVAAAQLNRSTEEGQRRPPRLSDLRESGSIEADADIVVLLHRPQEDGDEIEARVAKHRNGPTGVAKLLFRRPFARFDDPRCISAFSAEGSR